MTPSSSQPLDPARQAFETSIFMAWVAAHTLAVTQIHLPLLKCALAEVSRILVDENRKGVNVYSGCITDATESANLYPRYPLTHQEVNVPLFQDVNQRWPRLLAGEALLPAEMVHISAYALKIRIYSESRKLKDLTQLDAVIREGSLIDQELRAQGYGFYPRYQQELAEIKRDRQIILNAWPALIANNYRGWLPRSAHQKFFSSAIREKLLQDHAFDAPLLRSIIRGTHTLVGYLEQSDILALSLHLTTIMHERAGFFSVMTNRTRTPLTRRPQANAAIDSSFLNAELFDEHLVPHIFEMLQPKAK